MTDRNVATIRDLYRSFLLLNCGEQLDDDECGFRARRMLRSFCAHNFRIITREKKNVWGK